MPQPVHPRFLRQTAGWSLVVVGTLTAPTPVPLGALMAVAGLCLVARDSRRLRGTIRHMRGRFPWLSTRAHGLRHRLPVLLRRVLETTDPRRRPRFSARVQATCKRPV